MGKPVKWWQHQLDIYDVELHMARTPKEYRALRRQIKTLDPINVDAAGVTSSHLWVQGERHSFNLTFWLDRAWCREASAGEVVGLCAHEASHGVGMLLDHMSADRRDFDPGGEPLAYLHGWLTEWLYKGLHR